MPIREYVCQEGARGCEFCKAGFEHLERIEQEPLAVCPRCGAAVARRISAPSFAKLSSNFDDRAKSAGFHKLKRLGHGEYEKLY